MGMRPTLWTVNGLSTETGVDRRAVAKQLAGIEPDGKARGEDAWLLKTYLAAAGNLTSYEAERTRYMRLRADALQEERTVRRGELVPMPVFKRYFDSLAYAVRGRIWALPSKFGSRIHGRVGDQTKALVVELQGLVRGILTEISEMSELKYFALADEVKRGMMEEVDEVETEDA